MDQELYQRLLNILQGLGQSGLTLNHYDLAEKTAEADPNVWRQFLALPEIHEWRTEEFKLISASELKKTINNIHNSRSVGQSQIIGALAKFNEGDSVKTGPAFIYCYTPMNNQELQADNIQILTKNPFPEGDIT